ncbi:MAG: tetratricopeptide repeat protein [Nitrospinae bacterium]|nr:tetratricopeptide repeat protein [Nitrospinota bacterium]
MVEKSDLKDSPASMALAYGRIAKSLHGVGERSLALDLLDRGIKKFPDVSGIYISKGEILVSVYNTDGKVDFLKAALSSFEKALKLDPQNYLARLLASQIYLKAGKTSRAKELVAGILDIKPDDERALSLMNAVKELELKAAPQAEPVKAPEPPREELKAESEKEEPKAEAAVETPPRAGNSVPAPTLDTPRIESGNSKPSEAEDDDAGEVVVAQTNSSAWSLDEKVVIGGHEDTESEIAQEELAAKLTLFSKLEGLMAIFLLDQNGQPIKMINKAKLDVNITPSLIFNLHNASINGIRRTGLGSFQRGVLVTPIGTFIIANAFYATLGVVVDNDANMAAVEARIQRYLGDISS